MDGLLFLLLLGVAIIGLAVAALALANRVVFKMAARNFARRKAQSAIVIAGFSSGSVMAQNRRHPPAPRRPPDRQAGRP